LKPEENRTLANFNGLVYGRAELRHGAGLRRPLPCAIVAAALRNRLLPSPLRRS
jgi:hypothetical protein